LIDNIDKFQIHIKSKEKFILKVSLKPDISKKEVQQTIYKVTQKMRAILDEKLMTHVKFDVDIVNTLWADQKTGKFRLIAKE